MFSVVKMETMYDLSVSPISVCFGKRFSSLLFKAEPPPPRRFGGMDLSIRSEVDSSTCTRVSPTERSLYTHFWRGTLTRRIFLVYETPASELKPKNWKLARGIYL